MKMKAILFDMDGVLLDSMSIWDTMGSRYLLRRGIAADQIAVMLKDNPAWLLGLVR